ncbi:relaxase/mobilization nuclease domain-containing protein [Pseudomonas libanensis]|uniref:MobA/VirD2-like nuclease domain-containing protein n=1 Tax=Pseudomonas libanensis TaxID=75588 RepID=A0ABR5MDC7_9PSED|nr:relaxase/mobilization nuclease domain-containing protein [Pseudomonas libanensis]KPG77334.1 hypothetical protein AEQ48_03075 [Pseudomonas libanensis]
MIIKKLSVAKTGPEVKRTLLYVLKKSALSDTSKKITQGSEPFAAFLADKIEARRVSRQKNLTTHFTVSFHPSDKVDELKALEIAKSLFESQMGLSRNYTFAVHTDTSNIHVHAVLELRDNAKKVYSKLNDFRELEALAAKAEIKHNLYRVERKVCSSHEVEKPNPNPLNSVRRLEQRTGKDSNKRKLMLQLKPENFNSSDDFLSALILNDFKIRVKSHNEKHIGYTLEKESQVFKASELGVSSAQLSRRYGEDIKSVMAKVVAYSQVVISAVEKIVQSYSQPRKDDFIDSYGVEYESSNSIELHRGNAQKEEKIDSVSKTKARRVKKYSHYH